MGIRRKLRRLRSERKKINLSKKGGFTKYFAELQKEKKLLKKI